MDVVAESGHAFGDAAKTGSGVAEPIGKGVDQQYAGHVKDYGDQGFQLEHRVMVALLFSNVKAGKRSRSTPAGAKELHFPAFSSRLFCSSLPGL